MAADSRQPLLVELGTEELPPKALLTLAEAFAGGIADGLMKAGMLESADDVRVMCTPRRLAVLIPNVSAIQAEQQQERRGPALNAALDKEGNATKALSGFAASCGVGVDALEKLETDKGSWFVYRATAPGQPVAMLLPGIVNEAIAAMPIPKPMRWGDHDYAFVRPAHWLLMLHGADVIDGEVLGIRSGRHTRGHRFHHPEPVEISNADEWLDRLREVKVLANQNERRQRVRDEVEKVTPKGMTARLGDELLDEIANLTEWPVAIACAFDAEFLDVPHEALVLTMQTNQKFVPVFSADGALTEHFIGVANIESKDPAEIRKGYERVIRPRFADAKFFYDEDRKVSLESYQAALKSVTYQQQLGSVWDKTVRVAELARVIANRVGVDGGAATRAAALAKCDLVTRMVGEFPELQGVMGRSYASQGEKPEAEDVSAALDEFYQPRFAGDAIADGKVGQVLAIAERIDTLVGIFAVGMKPSGNKDPFALRRAALGLARTLIEGEMDIDLHAQLIEASDAVLSALPEQISSKASKPRPSASELADEVFGFVLDRMRGYYADQDIGSEVFDAVRATHPHSLLDFDRRVRAVHAFAALPEARALAAANKRIGNILRQSEQTSAASINRDLLEPGAETALVDQLESIGGDAEQRIKSRNYVGLLRLLAGLRKPIDDYFDAVMVMADDPALRANRLALLGRLRNLFLHVADISMLPNG